MSIAGICQPLSGRQAPWERRLGSNGRIPLASQSRPNRILALSLQAMTATECPQCGSRFECGAQLSDTPCWCVSLPALPPQELGRQAASCYCPSCLGARLKELGLLEPS